MNNNNITRLVLTLTVIGIISAFTLFLVYQWTLPYIQEHQARARREAIFTVLPDAVDYEEVEKNDRSFYEGYDEDGRKVGVAFIGSGPGYQGVIEVMVGSDPAQEEVLGISILEHEETPGLGARITETEYREQFRGKPFTEYDVIRQEATEEDEIEGIAGATISAEAVANIVEEAGEVILRYYGGGS